MSKTLGIDLGSNSLGWAILDDITLDVVDKGVVVFPEGVDLDAGSSLETPAAVRRAARMGRRMKFRRKMRKWHLLKLLIDAKMCPLTHEGLEEWKKHGRYPLANRAFLDWLKATDVSNPYCDRDAASRKKVGPLVLGRALYHLCQRRGFKSSRKDEAAFVDDETGEAKKQDKAMGAVKSDIAALTDEINKAGCRTLGQYFYKCLESEKGKLAKTRIRCRYTGRLEHYANEFDVIMDVQGYAQNDKLREKLYDAIFYQRPLRSQKHLVGNCPLEPHNPRAQIGHPAFEEFRMLAFVNNLTLEDEDGNYRDEQGNPRYPLTQADRKAICEEVTKVKKPTFKTLKKLFRKDPRFAKQGLWFHYYAEDDVVPSCPTRQRIAAAFGEMPYDEQMVFDALTFFDDSDKLAAWFKKHYPKLGEKEIGLLVSIHPKEGNANYSLKAINRMLPFLRRGFELSHARFCAKLPDIVSDYAKHEAEILQHLEEIRFCHRREKAERADMKPQLRKNAPELPMLHDRYREYLSTEWNVSEADWNRLYLRGDEEYQPETCYYPHGKNGECVKLAHPRLPPVQLGMMRNPLVQRSMTTLRRLVNYLGEHGKLDAGDTIRIELARSVNDFATRKAYQEWQKGRKAVRDEAAVEIARHGKAVTPDAVERYVLWKEQDGVCLYTGRTISIAELLNGNAFDIEHTLPRSLSGDDALVNKTICEAAYNRKTKQGRVPRDCPNWDEIDTRLRPWRDRLEELDKTCRAQMRKARGVSDPAAKSSARVKALVTRMERDYWRDKLRRFDMLADKLTARDGEGLGFKRRQLVDTGIMCSHAVDLLKCVYPKTFAVNGAATAFARKAWGVQADEAKDRTEHTHHAKDAMVIAALTPARFTAICTALKDDGAERRRECDVCPPPCEGFAEKVRHAADEILVKHILRQTTLRQSSKRNALAHAHSQKNDPTKIVKHVLSRGDTVRGQLHKDTFYGCIMDPTSFSLQKVVRKSLVGPVKDAEAILDKIVDPAIRAIVSDVVVNLKEKGVKFIENGMVKMPSGVPINKVRVFAANATNAQTLHDHAMQSEKEYKRPYYVTSAEGSNFRLAVFNVDGKMTVKVDNSLVWAQGHKKADYVPYERRPGFIGYIMPGAMALTYAEGNPDEVTGLSQRELVARLYKVVKFENNGRITFRRHIEARASVVLSKDLKASGKHATGESKIDLEHPHELLYVSPSVYLGQLLFEGIHFRMMLDGTIKFI